jgi:hypothetical protein
VSPAEAIQALHVSEAALDALELISAASDEDAGWAGALE